MARDCTARFVADSRLIFELIAARPGKIEINGLIIRYGSVCFFENYSVRSVAWLYVDSASLISYYWFVGAELMILKWRPAVEMLRTPEEVLKALIEKIVSHNIELTYRAPIEANYLGEAGFFEADPGGLNQSGYSQSIGSENRPRIVLYRKQSDIPGPALDELVILAHEFGHYQSFCAGEWTVAYENAINHDGHAMQTLPEINKEAIYSEEQRAWRYASEVLHELEFSDWSSFKNHQFESLRIYSDRLWPNNSA